MGRLAEVFRERREAVVDDLRQEFAEPSPNVSTALGYGLRDLCKSLSASYTLVSRRYSLWRLLEKHLDEPWTEVTRHPGVLAASVHPSLVDMKVSKCGKVLPDGGLIDATSGNEVARCLDSWLGLLVSIRVSDEKMLFGSENGHVLDHWLEDNAIQKAGTAEASAIERWLGSLNAMIFLLRNLLELRGAHELSDGYDWSEDVRREILRVEMAASLCQEPVTDGMLARRTGLPPAVIAEEGRSRLLHAATLRATNQYCTICWRETSKYEHYKRLVFGPLGEVRGGGGLSSKYCWLHAPSSDGTRYWADRKRASEIRKLRWRLYEQSKSGFVSALLPAKGIDPQEAAKIAYDIHRNDLRGGVVPVKDPKLRDRVAALMGQGLTQSKIAERLGVSRQAVSKVVKRLREIWAARAKEIENIDPGTNEIMDWSALVQRVEGMSATGVSVADMANEIGVYRHTIDAMLRWLQQRAD